MQVTQAIAAPVNRQQAANAGGGAAPPEEPKDRFVIDQSGGMAAGVIGLVMAGGANSLSQVGFSPGLVYGFDGFIGASIGMQMAEALGKNKLGGAAVGAGLGLAAAAAGTQFGWAGAFVTAGAFAVLRGVVLPTMVNR